MKKTSLFLLSFLCLGLSSAFSKELKFPEEGKALFTITIPDSWSPEFDDEGTLEAEDKDGHSYIAVWEEDTEAELETIAESIDEILDEYAKDVKLAGKPEAYNRLAGMPGIWVKGTAKDKEDGSGIGFEAIIFAINKKNAAVIYFDYSQDAPEAVVKNIVKILESVTPAK